MSTSLTRDLEKLVNDEVKSRHYKSAGEVVREALRLVRPRSAKLATPKLELAGIDQLDRGEVIEYGSVSELFDEVARKPASDPLRNRKSGKSE